ncbi:MAG: hypothetical protein IT204_00770, partial [Fimbriimonadaceae bacterium]|nr:hypothetical protein [Fimbriimonadaceae bacterium]
PGGGQGRGMMGGFGVSGTLEEISDAALKVKMMDWRGGGGGPGGGGGGQRPGGGQPQQGGGPGGPGGQPTERIITVNLNDKTGYRELTTAKEEDVAPDCFLAVVGTGTETQIEAKAACIYVAPKDEEAMTSGRVLMSSFMAIRRASGMGREERAQMAGGKVVSITPLIVKARGRDGAEREVTVTTADATKYLQINTIKHAALVKGRLVTALPVPQQGGAGGPGGGGGNRPQAALPLQGGGPGPGGPGGPGGGMPTTITAAIVLQYPEAPAPAGAPAQ